MLMVTIDVKLILSHCVYHYLFVLIRYQHEVSTQLTTKLPCPTLTDVRAALTDHHFTPLTVMLDLLELADLLRAEQMTLLIDTRQHGTQSLLHTGLARCQGRV